MAGEFIGKAPKLKIVFSKATGLSESDLAHPTGLNGRNDPTIPDVKGKPNHQPLAGVSIL
jgi:hypothetical protein